jgi:hypothetical protein
MVSVGSKGFGAVIARALTSAAPHDGLASIAADIAEF